MQSQHYRLLQLLAGWCIVMGTIKRSVELGCLVRVGGGEKRGVIDRERRAQN
jgi:hypothetical protein